ncbi:C4-dicarboxylate ABC transporter substrate-binding protein (plasmid) [Natrinema zhouii]|uniref:TAXI family TRAP transporter solute-binding subunit n=1 Tax=Natrinema zhouii TaxID=1710539 RepID=UPI001CFFD897|nr:TAXI family TRAP transporter solute-binding subunit [Natrinema zhouii]UHQ98523.1 C4-dicarboxylate ABC transporter substrate-binding protein [Natrinema zhouii]
MPEDGATRRRFLRGAAAASVLGIAGCLGGGGSDEMELRVGTSAGGTQDVGLAVERAVSESSDELSYSTVESPGYIGTLYRLDQDQFNAGIVDNNSMSKAAEDRGDFAEEGVDSIPYQGFSAFPYSIYVVARDGTGIETFDDLAGANVYPAEPGYSTRATTLDVWSQDPTADVFDEMNIMDMGVDDAPGAMEEERIDAAIAYGTPPVRYTGFVTEYDARVNVHYVEETDALVESAESYAGAGTSRIAYDDWGLEQDIGTDEVFTWNLEVNYVFHDDAGDDAVYELCRVVDEHNDVVNEGEEQFNDYESTEDMLNQALEGEEFPFHPGAVEYYQDNDVWDDSLPSPE